MSVFFENKIKLIEKHLIKRLDEYNDKIHSNIFSSEIDSNNFPTLIESMKYAVSGGKRIRPLLVILSYEAVTGEDIESCADDDFIESLLDIAVAIESIHAYSLVHDDLPCMDNDTYRRGELTVHAKFGETIGVLTGDALLNFAFETVFNSIKDNDTMIRYVNAGKILSFCAGSCGMIGGQVLDLDTEYLSNENILKQMVIQKTCALIYGAGVAGAIIGGADTEYIESIEKFALHLGMAFQMKDDLFDIVQDEKENKITLISKLTREEAESKIKYETNLAFSAIKNLKKTSDLQYFADCLMNRKH